MLVSTDAKSPFIPGSEIDVKGKTRVGVGLERQGNERTQTSNHEVSFFYFSV